MAGFSALAAAVHFALVALALPVPSGMHAPAFSAAALILTGAFQLTRLKEACLSHCRSPAGFLLSNWRPGAAGTPGWDSSTVCTAWGAAGRSWPWLSWWEWRI